jgi:hypothetical protein
MLPNDTQPKAVAAAAAVVQAHLRASNFDPYKSEVPMLPHDITPTPTLVTLPDTEQVGRAAWMVPFVLQLSLALSPWTQVEHLLLLYLPACCNVQEHAIEQQTASCCCCCRQRRGAANAATQRQQHLQQQQQPVALLHRRASAPKTPSKGLAATACLHRPNPAWVMRR